MAKKKEGSAKKRLGKKDMKKTKGGLSLGGSTSFCIGGVAGGASAVCGATGGCGLSSGGCSMTSGCSASTGGAGAGKV